MIEKAINFTDSDMVTVPRRLKVRPENETTSLAYVTKDEEKLLKENKPGTPHKGPEGIPNFNGGDVLTYTPSFTSSSYVGPTQQQQQQQREKNKEIRQSVVNTFNQQQGTNQQDTYTPPAQQYGPPPGMSRSKVNLIDMGFDTKAIKDLLLGTDPKVLAFFGYNPNFGNLKDGVNVDMPTQLFQMMLEGSIVTPMEAMQSDELDIGTYADLESGQHELFPGGLKQYYSDMSLPKFKSSYFPPGGAGFGGFGGSSGSYGAYLGAGLPMSPKQLGDEENIPPQARLLQYMVNLHRGNPYTKLAMRKKDGGLASIVGD